MTLKPIIYPDESLVDNSAIDAAALDRKLVSIAAASQAFENALRDAPERSECQECGGVAKLAPDASWKAGKLVYDCPACNRNRKERELGARIEKVGIPSDVRHATLENFETDREEVNLAYQTPASFLEAARQFVKGERRNAIFGGTPGIGKGHLAAAIAIQFLREGKRVAWMECARLFRDYHKAYANGTNEQITGWLGGVSLLVLDEICLRALPSDGEEILFAILDQRHKERKQTIMLANASADVIRSWLGGRITDRLRSGGVAFRYGEWKSVRGTQHDGAESEF